LVAALFRTVAKNRERGESPTQSGHTVLIGPNSLTLWGPREKCLTTRWDQGWSSDPDAKNGHFGWAFALLLLLRASGGAGGADEEDRLGRRVGGDGVA
jgi:hypothetical protein